MLRPKPEVTPESAGGHATLVARDVKWPTQPKHQTGCVKHQAILVTEFPFQPHLSANLQVTFYAVAVVSVLPLAVPFAAAASVPSLAAHTAKKETAEHSRSAINLYCGTVDNIAQSLLRFYRLNPIPEG